MTVSKRKAATTKQIPYIYGDFRDDLSFAFCALFYIADIEYAEIVNCLTVYDKLINCKK